MRWRPAPIPATSSAEMLRDAGAQGGDRRPFRAAARITARPTPTVRAKAHGGAARRPARDHLRRRDARRARRRPDPRSGRPRNSTARCRTSTGNIVIAYEPVWAIGSGLTPTAGDVGDMHGFIREQLAARYGEAAAGHPHPLRRLGEARERQGTCWRSKMSTARWSAAQASRPRTFWRSRPRSTAANSRKMGLNRPSGGRRLGRQ